MHVEGEGEKKFKMSSRRKGSPPKLTSCHDPKASQTSRAQNDDMYLSLRSPVVIWTTFALHQ